MKLFQKEEHDSRGLEHGIERGPVNVQFDTPWM